MEATEVKRAAAGRWTEILANVAGIDRGLLDGRPHGCPKCKDGVDRFRFIDPAAGAVYCNQCFNKQNGDGLSAVAWMRGLDFPATVKVVADYLGMNGQANGNGHAEELPFPVAAAYDYHDEAGRLLFQVCRGKSKTFRQRSPTPEGGWTWSTKGRRRVPYRLPELLAADKGTWVFVCEGEKDADNLAALGLVATTNPMGAGKWRPEFNKHFQARYVAVLPDNDQTGQEHGQDVAANVGPVAAVVKVVDLPGLPAKGDVSDWLNRGGTVEELLALVEEAPPWKREPKPEPKPARPQGLPEARPTIVISTDEMPVVDQAVDALAKRPEVFQRGGVLVQIVQGAKAPSGLQRAPDCPTIAMMKPARLRELLSAAASWQAPAGKEGELEPCLPPAWAVAAVDARGQWDAIRPLCGVVEWPTLRPDGTVLQKPGYDEATGLFLVAGQPFPTVPDRPTQEDARQAAIDLLEASCDFPFQSPTHRAAWLAAVLTPLARTGFFGPAPLVLIDANIRGAGKSLLAKCIATIVAGRDMTLTTVPDSDDELRKRITALAVAGDSLVLLDNVAGNLGSPSLDAALTATTWSDRVLGRTEMLSHLPLGMTWYATANNCTLVGDTPRRVLPIRLEYMGDNPEERTDFQHPDLIAWCQAERPRLVVAALTVLRAFCAAGKPDMGLKPWGSYEGWSGLVRAAVKWVGLSDPAGDRMEMLRQADVERQALVLLLNGWAEVDALGTGMTAREMLVHLGHHGAQYPALLEAIGALCPTKDEALPKPQALGAKLRTFRKRVVGTHYLDCEPNRDGVQVWTVKQVN